MGNKSSTTRDKFDCVYYKGQRVESLQSQVDNQVLFPIKQATQKSIADASTSVPISQNEIPQVQTLHLQAPPPSEHKGTMVENLANEEDEPMEESQNESKIIPDESEEIHKIDSVNWAWLNEEINERIKKEREKDEKYKELTKTIKKNKPKVSPKGLQIKLILEDIRKLQKYHVDSQSTSMKQFEQIQDSNYQQVNTNINEIKDRFCPTIPKKTIFQSQAKDVELNISGKLIAEPIIQTFKERFSIEEPKQTDYKELLLNEKMETVSLQLIGTIQQTQEGLKETTEKIILCQREKIQQIEEHNRLKDIQIQRDLMIERDLYIGHLKKRMIIKTDEPECLLPHVMPQDSDQNKMNEALKKFKAYVKIKFQPLHDKSYKCSGFKRIGKERIVYDFVKDQLQFMMQDSLTPLEPTKYEEGVYLGGAFDNPRDNCFYASLQSGYLVTINTVSQQKMNVLKLDQGMNINQMIWVENQQFLIGCTCKGSLLVISLTGQLPRIKQTFQVRKYVYIYSLQLSIKNPNEILLSTNKGIIFVNYTYNKFGQQFKFKQVEQVEREEDEEEEREDEENPTLFKDETIQGLLQFGNYLLVAICGKTSLQLYNRNLYKVEQEIPVQSGSKEFFGIRAISEDLAIVRDTQFISVIDLKKRTCFPVFQTILNESTGTHDYYLETQVEDEILTIHTLGVKKVPPKSQFTAMLRYEVPLPALREFINVLG